MCLSYIKSKKKVILNSQPVAFLRLKKKGKKERGNQTSPQRPKSGLDCFEAPCSRHKYLTESLPQATFPQWACVRASPLHKNKVRAGKLEPKHVVGPWQWPEQQAWSPSLGRLWGTGGSRGVGGQLHRSRRQQEDKLQDRLYLQAVLVSKTSQGHMKEYGVWG